VRPRDFALGKQQTTINPMMPKDSAHRDSAKPFLDGTIIDGMPNNRRPKIMFSSVDEIV